MNRKAQDRVAATEGTIRALFDAFFHRGREQAEVLIADDFTFTSPYDDGIDRAMYFERCWPNGERFSTFEIERIAASNEGAYVTYRCVLKDGTSFRNSEYLAVRGAQVTSVEVYFGATYRDGKFEPAQR